MEEFVEENIKGWRIKEWKIVEEKLKYGR
jgi:hypothetical protein